MGNEQSGALDGPARRETPIDVQTGRAARLLVAPVSKKIAAWHAESIKLETMAMRARERGRRDETVSEAAKMLLDFVDLQMEVFEQSLVEVPDVIRGHNRIADTRKVLEQLRERLETTVGQVEGRGDEKATRVLQSRHSP